MPPSEGERVPDFEALRCDGETFRARTLTESLDAAGGVLVFFRGRRGPRRAGAVGR